MLDNRDYALKCVKKSQINKTKKLQILQTEIEVMRKLNNNNVIQLYAVLESQTEIGLCYLS